MTVRELHIFDFDATLFDSPMHPDDWEGHIGMWYDTLQSLTPPCVIDPEALWIKSTVAAARRSLSTPGVYTVLMTGRSAEPQLAARVTELVQSAGLDFDEIHLKTGGKTVDWKSQMLSGFLRELPDLEVVQLWDDRSHHLEQFVKLVEDAGLVAIPHFVDYVLHEPCVLDGALRSEGLLREYVRTLLTEAAMGPSDLPDGVGIAYRQESPGMAMTVMYYHMGEGSSLSGDGWKGSRELAKRGLPTGKVAIGIPSGKGECSGAFEVYGANAAHGWGPMLYDVAMELATIQAGGLMSDRESVSFAARDVWQYYMANRGDVTGIQLDDEWNKLTPTERDNCMQQRARDDEGSWVDSPLSKRYTKPPIMINALKAAGKLVEL